MLSLIALVGTKFRGPDIIHLVASLPNGEPLTLIRERGNAHDPNAVQVWARNQHVGYLKGSQNKDIAMAMDRAQKLAGVHDNVVPISGQMTTRAVLRVTADRWPMVEIDE